MSYRVQRTADEAVNRNLDAIAAELAPLSALAAMFGQGGGKVSLPTAGFTVDGEAMIVWKGAAAAAGTLPGSKSLGDRIMREVTIVNAGSATVTVKAGSGDALVGTAAVTSGTRSVWRSDGVNTWFRVI